MLETVKELMAAGARAPEIIHVDGGRPAVVVPEDFRLMELPYFQERPDSQTGTFAAQTVEALCAFVLAHYRTGETEIFCDVLGGRIRAVIDSHAGGAGDMREAGYCAYSGSFELRETDDFRYLQTLCTGQVSQVDFAEFIEDHTHLFRNPSAAEMLEIALKLEGTQECAFTSHHELQAGDRTLLYKSATDAQVGDGTIAIPRSIEALCAIYEDTEPVVLKIPLRFRVTGGGVMFALKLLNLDGLRREAMQDVVARVETQCSGVARIYSGTFAK